MRFMTGIDSGRSSAARADATNRRLFIAGCVALVATAMSFAIRGDIMGDFERLFALNKPTSAGLRAPRSGASACRSCSAVLFAIS
ncbi:MAG: hypothetical protein DMF99_29365, partial [Acidobacteria bacterium]